MIKSGLNISDTVIYIYNAKRYITINDPSVSELFLTYLLGKRIITLQRKTEKRFELKNVMPGNYIVNAVCENSTIKGAKIAISK